MHFDYIKPGGIWGFFSLLTSSIMSRVDKTLYKTINGDEGGVWAPTNPTPGGPPSPIVIGGDGLVVTGPFVANQASITITAGNFLLVKANATFTTEANSTSTFNGTVVLAGTTSVTNTMTFSSTGSWALLPGSQASVNTGAHIEVSGSFFFGAYININAAGFLAIHNNGSLVTDSGSTVNYQAGTMITHAGMETVSGLISFTNVGVLHGVSGALFHWYGTIIFRSGASFTVESGASVGIGGGITVGGTIITNSIVATTATLGNTSVVGTLGVSGTSTMAAINRSGPDLPASSPQAYRAMRPTVIGPDIDAVGGSALSFHAQDFIECPTLSADRIWDFIATVPGTLVISVSPAKAHKLTVRVNGLDMYFVNAGLTSRIQLQYNGAYAFQAWP